MSCNRFHRHALLHNYVYRCALLHLTSVSCVHLFAPACSVLTCNLCVYLPAVVLTGYLFSSATPAGILLSIADHIYGNELLQLFGSQELSAARSRCTCLRRTFAAYALLKSVSDACIRTMYKKTQRRSISNGCSTPVKFEGCDVISAAGRWLHAVLRVVHGGCAHGLCTRCERATCTIRMPAFAWQNVLTSLAFVAADRVAECET
jgi:hypothetical protein